MEKGPFKNAVEASNNNIIKEEYTTYRIVGGYLEKTTVVRNHRRVPVKDNEYHDTTFTERLVAAVLK